MALCAVEGCGREGAFRTRTRPTWCEEHLKDVYLSGGLVLLEPFTKQTDYLLTRCTECGFQGHYRFEYVLDRNAADEAVCRACYWKDWAKKARTWASPPLEVDLEEVQTGAEDGGYDYLGSLTTPSLKHDPHAVRCTQCERVEAMRPADFSWGCPCSRNPKSGSTGGPAVSEILRTSNLEVVSWWDHDRNPKALWKTAKVHSRKRAWWKCQAGHSFEARIIDVTRGWDTCPQCSAERREARIQEEAKYGGLTVADVPELLAAWKDETPPESVLVTESNWNSRYRFQCHQGHFSTSQPLSYHLYGCPSCKAQATIQRHEKASEADPTYTRLPPEIASQWHPTKNVGLSLGTISPESRRQIWWLDPVCGHEFQATPRERDKYQRCRCQECKTVLDSLAYHYPEVAEEWAEDNQWSPWQIRPNSTKLVEPPLWQCREDPTHQWRAFPATRLEGAGCPLCRTSGKSFIELEYAEAAKAIWNSVESGQRIYSTKFANHPSWSVDILVTTSDGQRVVIEYDGAYRHQNKTDLDRGKSLDLLRDGCIVWRLRESPLPSLTIENPNYRELTVYPGAQVPDEDLQTIAAQVGR